MSYSPELLKVIQNEVFLEVCRAVAAHSPYNSAHEAFAVLLEEVDEFKAEVWKKGRDRDKVAMAEELIQVAAVAVRAIIDLELFEKTTIEVPV